MKASISISERRSLNDWKHPKRDWKFIFYTYNQVCIINEASQKGLKVKPGIVYDKKNDRWSIPKGIESLSLLKKLNCIDVFEASQKGLKVNNCNGNTVQWNDRSIPKGIERVMNLAEAETDYITEASQKGLKVRENCANNENNV